MPIIVESAGGLRQSGFSRPQSIHLDHRRRWNLLLHWIYCRNVRCLSTRGSGWTGPRYRIAIQAVSDELLLDQLSMAPSKGSDGRDSWKTAYPITGHEDPATGPSFDTIANVASRVNNFVPSIGSNLECQRRQSGEGWLALPTGRLTAPIARVPFRTAVHSLSETDGSLTLARPRNYRWCTGGRIGERHDCLRRHEPVAYVTEYFLGDGVTTQFNLICSPLPTRHLLESVIIQGIIQ